MKSEKPKIADEGQPSVPPHSKIEERLFDLTISKLAWRGYDFDREYSLHELARKQEVYEFCERFQLPLDDRLRVLMVAGDAMACGYWRIWNPAKYLKRNFADKMVVVTTMGVVTVELLRWADIIVMERALSMNHRILLKRFAEQDRIIITEDDDNFAVIEKENPSYELYKPNSANLYIWFENLEMADAHQVSTKGIKRWMDDYRDPYSGKKRFDKPTVILPNSIDFRDSGIVHEYEGFKTEGIPPSRKMVYTIGWMGSSAHMADLNVLNEPIAAIQRKRPDVRFTTIGWNGAIPKGDGKFLSVIPQVRIDRPTQYPLETFLEGLASEGLNIALAPLVDMPFNYAKSNLRLLEYAVTGSPIIASAVGEYREFRHALKVRRNNDPAEWKEAIEYLLGNPLLAGEMVKKAYREVDENYSMETNAGLYADFYLEMRKRYKRKLRDRI